MTHHLSYENHSHEGRNSSNSRNGKSRKTLKGKQGEILIEVPRDRNEEFEPQFVKWWQTRFDGFGDKIISLLAPGINHERDSGASGRDLRRGSLARVDLNRYRWRTGEVRAWQGRPPEKFYVILLDALVVKVK